MPLIRITVDNAKVSEEEMLSLSNAAEEIAFRITGGDVSVYAKNSHIKINCPPTQISLGMPADKSNDDDKLLESIKTELSKWAAKNNFSQPVSVALVRHR
jgi:hypothetical protein